MPNEYVSLEGEKWLPEWGNTRMRQNIWSLSLLAPNTNWANWSNAWGREMYLQWALDVTVCSRLGTR